MTSTTAVIPLVVFEAADCLMAVPAAEVAHLDHRMGDAPSLDAAEYPSRPYFDLGAYFSGSGSDGPWLHWARGTRHASLRVQRVLDVVPVPLSSLTPMPVLLRRERCTRAFVAAGLAGQDVFLLLDPACLAHSATGPETAGKLSSARGSRRASRT